MLRKIILCSLMISLFLGGEGFAKQPSGKKVVRITIYRLYPHYIFKNPSLELIITDNKIPKPTVDYFYHDIEWENSTLSNVSVVDIDYPDNLFNQIPPEFITGSHLSYNRADGRLFVISFNDGSYNEWSIFDDFSNNQKISYDDIESEKGMIFLDEIDRILYDGCKFLPVGKDYKWRKYCQ